MYDGSANVFTGTEIDPLYLHMKGSGITAREFLAQPEFYIAHRGSGGNWPEHTFTSYSAAAWHGLDALEISVHKTADNVLVCCHDENLTRVTGQNVNVSASTWDQLKTLTVTNAETDNKSQARAPFTKLSDVLDRFLIEDPRVLFVEAKSACETELFAMLRQYPRAPEYVVWKRWIDDYYMTQAKNAGYVTWGYYLGETGQVPYVNNIADYPSIDMVGIWHLMSDADIGPVAQKAIAAGKRVIMWEVRDIATRNRARALGVTGFMTQNIRNVIPHRLAL